MCFLSRFSSTIHLSPARYLICLWNSCNYFRKAINLHQVSGDMLCQEDPRSASAGFPHPPNEQENAVTALLLELAADNNVEAFKSAVEGGARVDQPEDWYARQIGKNKMALEQRTAIMVASLYGSIEVLSYILSLYDLAKTDINLANGSDGLSALHCAAAGGSANAVETVKLLLKHGANINVEDARGRKPCDVLMVSPKLSHEKFLIQAMLRDGRFSDAGLPVNENVQLPKVLDEKMNLSSLTLTEESDADNYASEFFCKMDGLMSACSSDSFSSLGSSSPPFSPVSPSSPKSLENHLEKVSGDTLKKPKGYSTDASLPDIKNSIYTTDEFRMFSFKIRPCSRAYSHDWTECPFVHPGENARRRDPRRYHYSCVPCPDFRKGACRRGDACEYAHGVFECWLHPAQYRTRLCKDGTSCTRRVCFFAHTTEELRPLYVSTGSALSSPRASPAFDSRSMSPPSHSFSPAPMLMAPPFSPSSRSGSTPPLSPSASSLRATLGGSWSPPNVPTLHLPSGGLHASRLRAALSARDIPLEEFDDVSDFDPSMASDLLFQFNQTRPISSLSSGAGNQVGRIGKYSNLALNIPSSRFPDLIASEINSPPRTNLLNELAHASPKMHHKMQSQLQLQMNALLSPRFQNMSHVQEHGFSRVDKHAKQAEYFDIESHPPVPIPRTEFELPSSPAASLLPDPSLGFSSLKSAFHLKDNKGSWSSKSLSGTASSSSSASWSDWGSPSGKPDWGVQGHDLRKLQKTSSLVSHGEMEPDLSWVQSLVKDGPGDIEKVGSDCFVGNVTDELKNNVGDHLLGAWIEHTHKNQVVA